MLALFLDLIDDPNDQQLFINIYEEYETALFKYAYSLLNDYHKSEDVLQDIFLKVARNIKALHGKEDKKIKNYLYIAVRRKVIDIIEKEQKLQVATVDFLNNMKDERASKEIDNLATKDIVIKVLNQIPDKYKEVLYLYLVAGFKEKEIADSLDIKINTLRQQIRRGRLMFAEIYEREMNE